MKIAVTGVCASGKTTLVAGLRAAGADAYNVAKAHSCLHNFWQKRHPDVPITIDARMPAIRQRRVVPWGEERLQVQALPDGERQRLDADEEDTDDSHDANDEFEKTIFSQEIQPFLMDFGIGIKAG